MTTFSDFGSLEIKQLRVQNDIKAVRYGTEIMDRDLVFKVGDISNPNQSIRFSVHDGEDYKDAFSVDSNGFSVSDIAMSGPSSGVIAIDELVKLGEMRVQHFDDHNNNRAGEIIFSVNIGDTDVETVDVLSISPEEVEITSATKIHSVLSCNNVNTNTVEINGNEFRSVVTSFNHPLGLNTVNIERDERGVLVVNGPLKSEESTINTLYNNVVNSNTINSTICSVSSLNINYWSIFSNMNELNIQGPGSVLIHEISSHSIKSTKNESDTMESLQLSSSCVFSEKCVFSVLSTSSLYFDSIECGTNLNLPNVLTLTLSDNVKIEENKLTLGSSIILSEENASFCGLKCSDGSLSVSFLNCYNLTSNTILTEELLADKVLIDKISVQNINFKTLYGNEINCRNISVNNINCTNGFTFSCNQNIIKFDENCLQANIIKSIDLSCSTLSSTQSIVMNLSCCNSYLNDLNSKNANIEELTTHELESNKCNIYHIKTSELNINDTTLSTKDNQFQISKNLFVPNLLTNRIRLHTLNFCDNEDEVSISISTNQIMTSGDFVCGRNLICNTAIHNIVSCTSLECDHLISKNFDLLTDDFIINTKQNTLRIDDNGIELSGENSSIKLSSDNENLILTKKMLKSSEEFEFTCKKLHLPETHVCCLSVGSIVSSVITHPDNNVNIDCNLMCDNLLTRKTLTAESTLSRELSTQVVYAEYLQKIKTISGGHGCEINFEDSKISLESSDFVMNSENLSFSLKSSKGEYFLISGPYNTTNSSSIKISSSENIEIEKNLSVSELTSRNLNVHTISSPSKLNISSDIIIQSHISIGDSCFIENYLVSENLSCSYINTNTIDTNSINNLTIVQSENVYFTDDLTETYMIVSKESVVIGGDNYIDAHCAKLDIISIPFKDGIRVTSDDKSTLKLQTKHNKQRGMILVNENDEWIIGVGNFPLEKENTFGIYFNNESFIHMIPVDNTIYFNKNTTITQTLSAGILHLHEINMRDCSLSVQNENEMLISCDSFVIPDILSVSNTFFIVSSQCSHHQNSNMNNNIIQNLGNPIQDGDAVNKRYIENRLEGLFTEERVFTAPVYWAQPNNPLLRSFAIGLSYTNPSNNSNTDISFEMLVGTSSNHSLKFVSDVSDLGAHSLVEFFASQLMKVYCPIEIDNVIKLPYTIISSSNEALTIAGNLKCDGIGIGVVPSFALHVKSTLDDDCAVLQSSSSRARTTVESISQDSSQAMFSCKVDSTVFSSGYSKSSDSFIIASSNDLSQNTHLVISRITKQIMAAGDIKIVKPDGSFTLEELGATVFMANKHKIKCENFQISFENFSVDHKVGNQSLLNLSNFGARISGSAELSGNLKIKNTILGEDEIGNITVNKKMIVPHIETNTLSIENRQCFNLYQDDTEVIRFRNNGSGMLLDFDSISESLNFSFPTIPNTNGRGALFVSDHPLFSLNKQNVNIDTNENYAKLNVSAEIGPQFSIINPSNTPAHTDFTINDSGELHVTSTQRKYIFDGNVHSQNFITDDFIYFGRNKQWRMGISDTGSFVIQSNFTGTFITKTEILHDEI
jgi:hypothetical protein